MADNAVDVHRLDPAKIVDLDLGGEAMRQGAMSGMCAKWAKSPPFYLIKFGVPLAFVGRYADARTVYTDDKHLSTTPPNLPGYERFNVFNGMISVAQTDGADHDRIRRLMNPSFAPAALAQIDDHIKAIVTAMLDDVEALGGPFDCMNDFARHVVVRIVLDGLLGLTVGQQAAFVRMHKTFDLLSDLAPGEDLPTSYLQAQQEVLQVMDDVFAERRARSREHDFVSTLVNARYNTDKLSDAELTANIFAILAGGLGTTSTATGAMLMNLCRHRDQFDQVIAEPRLIPQTVEESLRYQGPLIFSFPRFATEDFEIGGTPILKHMPVHVSPMAANLDSDQYPDPLKFDIHRTPKNILTFGTGRHHCLGNRLARRVLAIILEQVCQRFPNLRLQNPEFTPRYLGTVGDLNPASIPMHTGK